MTDPTPATTPAATTARRRPGRPQQASAPSYSLARATAASSSEREQDCGDATSRADGDTGETDLGRTGTVASTSFGVVHLLCLAELTEVEHALRPEAGAESEASLEIPRRGGSGWKGNQQPAERRRIDGHEPGEQDDRGTETDVSDPPSSSDLGMPDVAGSRLVSLARG